MRNKYKLQRPRIKPRLYYTKGLDLKIQTTFQDQITLFVFLYVPLKTLNVGQWEMHHNAVVVLNRMYSYVCLSS